MAQNQTDIHYKYAVPNGTVNNINNKPALAISNINNSGNKLQKKKHIENDKSETKKRQQSEIVLVGI